MKKTIVLLGLLFSTLISISQVLGGYAIYDRLVTAVHPYGCDASYVTNFPDDSIWVNFNDHDSMTGNFSQPHSDAFGNDLLLETGYNTSNYIVSLLLTNNQYSNSHLVVLSDWLQLPFIDWQFITTNCMPSFSTYTHYIVPLDFISDFGLTPLDTVKGIKIIFLTSPGDPDLAGAYIIKDHVSDINTVNSKPELNFSPNPFTDFTMVNAGSNLYSNIKIEVYDAYGNVVNPIININQSTIKISRGNLLNGIYFVKLWDNEKLIAKRTLIIN